MVLRVSEKSWEAEKVNLMIVNEIISAMIGNTHKMEGHMEYTSSEHIISQRVRLKARMNH